MKTLLTLLLILTFGIANCQMSYEFSTWLKTEPIEEYSYKSTYGQVAKTKKQALIPWKVTGIAIFATVTEAIGDGLYDNGKTNGNQNQMMTGKAFQATSIGAHFLYIPAMKNSNTSWLLVPVVEAIWRFILFDITYNLTRGLNIGYIGNTTYWDRGMQSFAPPPVMRLFADGVAIPFVIRFTFDNF